LTAMTALTHSRVRRLQRWALERVGRGKWLLRCCLLGVAKHFSAHVGRRGARHEVAAARLQLVWFALCVQIACICLELNVL